MKIIYRSVMKILGKLKSKHGLKRRPSSVLTLHVFQNQNTRVSANQEKWMKDMPAFPFLKREYAL